jgi:hypothetical protein
MANPIDLIESKIKEIIESSASLFPWMDEHASSVHRLVEAFQDYINSRGQENSELPALFVISMNPVEYARWKAQPDWKSAIAHTLIDTARELGQPFDLPPSIELIPNKSLNFSEVRIDTRFENLNPGYTSVVPVGEAELPAVKTDSAPGQAGLILENEKVFALSRSVTNIGRRTTNHLVINDIRVSRIHAQIRFVNGSYMIFDTGSSGGTFINGERIQQSILRPGDVISLAGSRLIFVIDEHEENTRRFNADTRPF